MARWAWLFGGSAAAQISRAATASIWLKGSSVAITPAEDTILLLPSASMYSAGAMLSRPPVVPSATVWQRVAGSFER